MTIAEQMAKDLLTIESDMGNQTFTWDGEDYVCIPSPQMTDAVLEIGGEGGDDTRTVRVRLNLFNGMYPQKTDAVTFDGIDYEVSKITKDAFGVFFAIVLVNPSP